MIQSITSFIGMFPRYTAYTLPKNAAQNIVDGRITSNGLEAYRADAIVKDLDTLYEDVYLHYRQGGNPQWLLFDKKVDICRSSTYDDVANRTFVSGLDTLRVFDDNTLRLTDTTITDYNSYKVAVPKPEATAVMEEVDPESAVGSEETRAYAIAYARTWESSKIDLGDLSDPVVTVDDVVYIDCKTDSKIKISNIQRPADLYDHLVNTVYVYRTSVTSEGVASYRYVEDFPLHPSPDTPAGVVYDTTNNTVAYTDSKKPEDLGEEPQNVGWSAPVDGLTGIVSLHNGVLAGFDKNIVYLSVPYQGHAWPQAFSYPLDYSIVGLGAFGNTLVVCTEAITYLLNASDPSLAYMTPIQDAHACVSKQSICSMDNACVYASKYGLIQITGNGAAIITKDLISSLEWGRLAPETIKAAIHRGQYVMFWDDKTSSTELYALRGYVIDFLEPEKGIIGISQFAHAIFSDPVNNVLYLVYNNSIDSNPVIAAFAETIYNRKAYTWTSKTFLDNTGLFNLSAGKINFHKGTAQLAEQGSIEYTISFAPLHGHMVNTYAINGDASTNLKNKVVLGDKWCILSLYVDDILRHTTKVYNNKPFRLPAGFRGDSYYITLTSTEPITRVQVASSFGELE